MWLAWIRARTRRSNLRLNLSARQETTATAWRGSRVCGRAALQGRAGSPAPARHNTSGTRGDPARRECRRTRPSRCGFIFQRRQPYAELPLRPSFLGSASRRLPLVLPGQAGQNENRVFILLFKRLIPYEIFLENENSVFIWRSRRAKMQRHRLDVAPQTAESRRVAGTLIFVPNDCVSGRERKRLPGTADLEIGEPRGAGFQLRSGWRRLKPVRRLNPTHHAAWLFLERH